MNAAKTDMLLARQLYQPDVDAMRNSLPDLGESLNVAALELARDFSLERLDQMLARIESAESNLVHLRKAIQVEKWGIG